MAKKKLYRSRTDKVIAGVAGGLGEYFDIESIFFRILFLLLAFVANFWPIVALYFVLVFIIPKKPHPSSVEADNEDEAIEFSKQPDGSYSAKSAGSDAKWYEDGRVMAGVALVVIGIVAMVNQFTPAVFVGGEIFWAALLIVLGGYIIWKNKK